MAKVLDLNARIKAKQEAEEAKELAAAFLKDFGDQPKEFFIQISKAIKDGDKEAYMAIIRPKIEKKAFIETMKELNQ